MKERPILYTGPNVRAILDGRKTQTRRVVKPQPFIDDMGNFHWNGWNFGQGSGGRPHVQAIASPIPSSRTKRVHCPYGRPGDRLWVRETFALQHCADGEPPPFDDGRPIKFADENDEFAPPWMQPHYRATDPAPDLCCERENCAQCRDHDMGPHWKPSIHMPRWASRITLEITGVRVERLQDITLQDAVQEGYPIERETKTGHEPFIWFRDLWESINGPESWPANPWVWVIEFKRLEGAA
jgi:hypothetical protein